MTFEMELKLTVIRRELALIAAHIELARTQFFSLDKVAKHALSIYQELLS